MIEISNYNIVIIGQGLANTRLQLTDFDFVGHKAVETLRIGFVFQVEAGPFSVLALPDRYQLTATADEILPENIECLVSNAKNVIELVGRRTVAQIGLNFQAVLSEPGLEGLDLVGKFVNRPVLEEGLGFSLETQLETVAFFETKLADTGRIKFEVPRDSKKVNVEFNYHTDMTTVQASPRPANVIDGFAAVVEDAHQLSERLGAYLSPEKVRT